MKIVVGLGNPGKKYEHTRHNAGFLAIDYLAKDLGNKPEDFAIEKKTNSLVLQLKLPEPVLLVKPQTFMNNSGEAILELCNFYKVTVAKDLLVIHDEIDLPLGTLRATSSSSAAGHNGVKDIVEKLGSQDFHRLRLGVESRESRLSLPTDVFVLQNFSEEELEQFTSDVLPKATQTIKNFWQKK